MRVGAVVVLLVAVVAASPALAAAGCGQTVIDAWAAGTLQNDLPASCYRDALAALPADMAGYSTAPEAITQALHVALRRERTQAASASPLHPVLVVAGALIAVMGVGTVAARRLRR